MTDEDEGKNSLSLGSLDSKRIEEFKDNAEKGLKPRKTSYIEEGSENEKFRIYHENSQRIVSFDPETKLPHEIRCRSLIKSWIPIFGSEKWVTTVEKTIFELDGEWKVNVRRYKKNGELVSDETFRFEETSNSSEDGKYVYRKRDEGDEVTRLIWKDGKFYMMTIEVNGKQLGFFRHEDTEKGTEIYEYIPELDYYAKLCIWIFTLALPSIILVFNYYHRNLIPHPTTFVSICFVMALGVYLYDKIKTDRQLMKGIPT